MPVVGAYMFVCFHFCGCIQTSDLDRGKRISQKMGRCSFDSMVVTDSNEGERATYRYFGGMGQGFGWVRATSACRQCHRSGQRAKSPSVYVSHNAKVRAVFGISDAKVFKHNGIRCLGWNSEFRLTMTMTKDCMDMKLDWWEDGFG